MKSTDELRHEIRSTTKIEDFLTENEDSLILPRLSTYLNDLLLDKQLCKADVIRSSHLDRKYAYQIFSGQKLPSREKLLSLAFGLQLSADEAGKLLKTAGYQELYARNKRDAILLFSLDNHFTLLQANDLLYEHHFHLLSIPTE